MAVKGSLKECCEVCNTTFQILFQLWDNIYCSNNVPTLAFYLKKMENKEKKKETKRRKKIKVLVEPGESSDLKTYFCFYLLGKSSEFTCKKHSLWVLAGFI